MPTSQHYQIPKILDLLMAADPASLLDVGVGFGKYGFLAREYLELWGEHTGYATFTRRIDGIEIYKEYLTPVHAYLYDHVYTGDALQIVPSLKTAYDLTLLIDVLEHFEKPDGTKLLKALLRKSRGILISVPKDIGDQGEVFGNIHETHHAEWTPADFRRISPALFIRDTTSTIAYLGKPNDIRRIKRALLKQRVWRHASASPLASRALRAASRFLKKPRA
jgi:hypothetical protein